MRWFKHLALANEDEKISILLEDFGPEGYGIWWLLLETIAASMDAKGARCELTYSVRKWSQKLCCPTRKVRSIIPRMHDLGLVASETVGDRLRISVPNLLKYRDEYSKKSGQPPDSLRTDFPREQKKIKEEGKQKERSGVGNLADLTQSSENIEIPKQHSPLESTSTNALTNRAKQFLAKYPNRTDLSKALQQYMSVIKSDAEADEADAGLDRYIASRKWRTETGELDLQRIKSPYWSLCDRNHLDHPDPFRAQEPQVGSSISTRRLSGMEEWNKAAQEEWLKQ